MDVRRGQSPARHMALLSVLLVGLASVAAARQTDGVVWDCAFSTRCEGASCSDHTATALVVLGDGKTGASTLFGTHSDPDWMMRLNSEVRVIPSVRADWSGDFAVTLADDETMGVLNIDYSSRAHLSLHVDGADHDYAEYFAGSCEMVN
jgi:hypothetical protein